MLWIALILMVLLYFPVKLFVLFLVKNADGFVAKFWGADFYTFDIKKRKRKVRNISIIVDLVISVLFAVLIMAVVG